MGIPYIGFLYFYYRYVTDIVDRYLIETRLENFKIDLDAIHSYHKRYEKKLLPLSETFIESRFDSLLGDKISKIIKQKQILVCELMVDFVITDYRYAFQSLLTHPGVRVAVYMEASETELERVAISWFGSHEERARPFLKGRGYCGICWETKKPICGTHYPFPFRMMWSDEKFLSTNVIDDERSFLCLPVTFRAKGSDDDEMIAVICIDSIRQFDFVLKDNTMRKIDQLSDGIKEVLLNYIGNLPSPSNSVSSTLTSPHSGDTVRQRANDMTPGSR
jgi:hypothetical protein